MAEEEEKGKGGRERPPAAPAPRPVTPRVVRREMRDLLRSHEQRRRQIPRALLVGVLAGLVAVAFQWLLRATDHLRDRVIAFGHALGAPAGVPLVLGLGAFGVAVAVTLVRRFEPDTAGSGIAKVKAVLRHLRAFHAWRVLPVKFFGGVTGIGAGLALGREGPTIQMGAAIGHIVAGWVRCTPRERQTLIAAGSGAGLSAAFNAPLAGLVFVLEELQRDFAPGVFTVTLVASVTADVVVRSLFGHLPVFHVGTHPIPPLSALPVSLLLGVVAGLLGIAFNRGLLGGLRVFDRVASWPPWAVGGLVGAAVGGLGWFLPEYLGGGHRIVEATLAGSLTLDAVVLFLVVRFGLTLMSYGVGAPGGILAPLLGLGAGLGLMAGELAHGFLPFAVMHPETYPVVGMAAFFTAVVRAPLTGIVLVVEMTGDYSLVLPLLVASLTAGGLADFARSRPIYEALLKRDLLRWQEKPELTETLLLELSVVPGAPFEGRAIRDLGLPPGCILINLRRGEESRVPTADDRLAAGDRITVVVSPQAAEAVPLLHAGTEAPEVARAP